MFVTLVSTSTQKNPTSAKKIWYPGKVDESSILLYAFHVISMIMDTSLATPWKPYSGFHGINQHEPVLKGLITDKELTHHKVEKCNI